MCKQEALEWKDRYDSAQIQMNLSTELRNLSIQKLKQLQVSFIMERRRNLFEFFPTIDCVCECTCIFIGQIT